jgi:alpha-L-rhamnosidase
VVLRALNRIGRSDLALRIIRERWGRRMVEKGETSTLEEWYHNGGWRDGPFTGFLRTGSHAGSACPADFLIRDLIGLEIVEPGCAKVRLAPRATDFDYDVTFPTPRGGDVRVECASGEICTESEGEVEVLR